MNVKKYIKNTDERGVVILFAMLAIGLLVGVGVAMSGLTQQQLILSSIGKQSQVAFYAADTGAECARYWDTVKNAFVIPTDGSSQQIPTCATITPSDFLISTNGTRTTSTFTIDITSPSSFNPKYNYCASITVVKNTATNATTIQSRGYNLPCVAQYSTRKVERAVQLTY